MNSRLAACVLASCGAVALLGAGRRRAPCGSCAADDDGGRRRLGDLFGRPGAREEVEASARRADHPLAGHDPVTEGDVAVDFFLLSGQSNAVSQRSANPDSCALPISNLASFLEDSTVTPPPSNR